MSISNFLLAIFVFFTVSYIFTRIFGQFYFNIGPKKMSDMSYNSTFCVECLRIW